MNVFTKHRDALDAFNIRFRELWDKAEDIPDEKYVTKGGAAPRIKEVD